MPQFRKKPVVIEAIRYVTFGPGSSDYFNNMPDWLEAAYEDEVVSNVREDPSDTKSCRLKIVTLEGTMYAGQGDWIIRGIKGELYPCKPDIFDATYEPE